MAFTPPVLGQASPRFRQDGPVIKLDEGQNRGAERLYGALQSAGQMQKDAATVAQSEEATKTAALQNEGTQRKLDGLQGYQDAITAEQQARLAGDQMAEEQAKQKSYLQLAVLESIEGNYGNSAIYSDMSKQPLATLSNYVAGAIAKDNPLASKLIATEHASSDNIKDFMLVLQNRYGLEGKPVKDEDLQKAFVTYDSMRETSPLAFGYLEKMAEEALTTREKFKEERVRSEAVVKKLELDTQNMWQSWKSQDIQNDQNQQRIDQNAQQMLFDHTYQTKEQADRAARLADESARGWAAVGITQKNSQIAELTAAQGMAAKHSESFNNQLKLLDAGTKEERSYLQTLTSAIAEANKVLAKDPNNEAAKAQLSELLQHSRETTARIDKLRGNRELYQQSGGDPKVMQQLIEAMQKASAQSKNPTSADDLTFQAATFNLVNAITTGANQAVANIFTPEMALQGSKLLQMQRDLGTVDIDVLLNYYKSTGNTKGVQLLSDPGSRELIEAYVELQSSGPNTK